MTTVHGELVGDKALLPRGDLDRLVELARRSEQVELDLRQEDVPASGIMRLAQQGGAFDWLAGEPDLYSVDDLKVSYR